MPRKPEPSFELKLIIWDVAATVGKDKPTDIQRQLDYELEKRRKEGNFFEDAPDVRTISRIVEEINGLPPEVVVSKLEPHVWYLRNDYEAIKQLAQGSGQTSEQSKLDLEQKLKPQTYLETQETRIHDKGIFENSDKILSESEFENIFEFLSRNSCLKSQLIGLLRFPEYFDSESNKYADWRLNYLCLKLCQILRELSFLIEIDSVERIWIEHNYDYYKEKSVDNEYSRLLNKLLENAPDIDINSLERLDNLEMEELYLIMDGKSHILIGAPEMPHLFNYEHYIEWQREFDKLTTHARTSYKEYRAAVRETLSL